MMRGRRLAKLALAGTITAAAVITAAPGVAAGAPGCTSDLCMWSGTNYTGTQSTAGYFDKNTHCYPDKHFNSTVSKTGYKIRMYNGSSCNGSSFILKPGQKIANTKFVVHSFKRA